jgi:PEGA domain
MRNSRFVAALVLTTFFCAGCATLFQGTHEEIMVASDPSGAQVTTNDGRSGTTPYSMRISRDEDLQIHISKAGYSPIDIADTSHVEWGYLISDVFFTGLIGLGVDGLDGAMFYHNQSMVTAHLEPLIQTGAVTQKLSPPRGPTAAAASPEAAAK